MKFCPQCNSEYKDSIYFCLKDGSILKYYYESREPLSTSDLSKETFPERPRRFPPIGKPKETFEKPSTGKTIAVTENTSFHTSTDTISQNYQAAAAIPTSQTENTLAPKKILLGSLIIAFCLFAGITGSFFGYKYLATDELIISENDSQTESSNSFVSLNNTFDNSAENPNNSNSVENQHPEGIEINANLSLTSDSADTKQNPVSQNPKSSPVKQRKDQVTQPVEDLNLPEKTPQPIEKTPTPVYQPPTPKPSPTVVTGGVVNSRAINLIKPPYPPIARQMRISGSVNVQVMIDENGNVISAKAISGNALLRGPAENAARASKFSPTYLSGQRVKVSGLIIYNFLPSN